MRNLTSPAWIYFKGLLFLLLGFAFAALLISDVRTLKATFLLALCVWSFCRFYYFAFYVIERYVDPSHRFSGLLSFAHYLFKKK
jgi:hypothetical protein